jgi:hypothetical protein
MSHWEQTTKWIPSVICLGLCPPEVSVWLPSGFTAHQTISLGETGVLHNTPADWLLLTPTRRKTHWITQTVYRIIKWFLRLTPNSIDNILAHKFTQSLTVSKCPWDFVCVGGCFVYVFPQSFYLYVSISAHADVCAWELWCGRGSVYRLGVDDSQGAFVVVWGPALLPDCWQTGDT